VLAATAAIAWLGPRHESAASRSFRPGGPRAAAVVAPAPVRPRFTVPNPRPLRAGPPAVRWASVLRAAVPLRRPGGSRAPGEALPTTTPEGTRNLVLVAGRAVARRARLWVPVLTPGLPHRSAAWVPRDALGGYTVVRTRLVVDRAALRLTLYRDGRRLFRAPVGVGEAAAPTPAGRFYVRDRVTAYRSSFYGPLAFGTSARSPTLTDWPGGGFIGIHGTDRPDLIPGRVSHGCIRLRNPDIRRLAALMPVGTPVTVR
jgi:hypothetical protein